MKRAFMLGAAALVASCVFAQDVFAQRGGSRGFGEDGYRAAARLERAGKLTFHDDNIRERFQRMKPNA
jgi:hypothetical protein